MQNRVVGKEEAREAIEEDEEAVAVVAAGKVEVEAEELVVTRARLFAARRPAI